MNAKSRYVEPDWFTRNIFNRAGQGLTHLGISVWASRELRVRGRKSGDWRTTMVNLLTIDGERYLVAPRGVTQWVRNLCTSGGGDLRVGRRVEAFHAAELDDPVDRSPDAQCVGRQVDVLLLQRERFGLP